MGPIEKSVIQAVRADLASARDRIAADVSAGKCASFDDYRRQTGQIMGLNQALNIINEAIKKHIQDGD